MSEILFHSFLFFFYSPPTRFCSDIVPLSQWVFTRVNELTGEAWCKRTEGRVGLSRARQTMWGHSTDQLHRGSFPKWPFTFAFLMLLLSHCTDDKISAWPEVPPSAVGHHSDCSLILWVKGCSLSFSSHAQCLTSSNRGTAGVRDCLCHLYEILSSYLAKQYSVLGFGNTIHKVGNGLLRENTITFDYQQSSELQSKPTKIPACEFN